MGGLPRYPEKRFIGTQKTVKTARCFRAMGRNTAESLFFQTMSTKILSTKYYSMQSNISTNDTFPTHKRARRKTHDTLPSNNKNLSGGVTMATLPAMRTTGFVRLPQVLQLIPISKSAWWDGCKSGRFSKLVKLGPRTTAWRAEDIVGLKMLFIFSLD